MTERSPGSDVETDAERSQHALISLHALAGTLGPIDPGGLPGFRSTSPATALRAVAEAPEDEIPASARLAILHDLARADFPDYEAHAAEYRLLASSVTEGRDLDVDGLLDDIKTSAAEQIPFGATTSGRRLPHHLVAFVGEDVCTTRTVEVEGVTATWIFSEFETDAPFDHVVEWVDPRNWPDRGPLLFKRMEVVGGQGPTEIASLGNDHWHGVFHEEVQILRRLNTLLHCDYWRDGGRAAGMTYALDLSLDGQIDVDRGFLSVDDVGGIRRVKALKVVGFTADIWDQVAPMVCPFWTDWVRGAVEGGTTSTPKAPTPPPVGAPTSSPTEETIDAWLRFFGDSARTYLALFDDVNSKARSGGYAVSDWLEDGSRYWSQLAKDWAQAWTYGMDLVEEVAREGLDAGFTPPGTPREAGRGMATAATAAAPTDLEGTLIPVTGLGESDRPACSDLISIEAGGSTLASGDIAVRVEALDDGTYGVRLGTKGPSHPVGLYVGHLENPPGQRVAPVQLYVSGAIGAEGP